MAIEEHYHEVVETLDSMLLAIFRGLKEKFSHEIATIQKQFPCEEFIFLDETLKLPFKEGMKMLKEAGATDSDGSPIGEMDDMRWVWACASFRGLGCCLSTINMDLDRADLGSLP